MFLHFVGWLFNSCWLVSWANSSFFCGIWLYPHVKPLIHSISPHPQSHPCQAKLKLFTLSWASYKWVSAKSTELFSRRTVNTRELPLRACKIAEVRKWISMTEKPDLSWMTGFVPEGLFKPCSNTKNIWMLFNYLKVLAGVKQDSYIHDSVLHMFKSSKIKWIHNCVCLDFHITE